MTKSGRERGRLHGLNARSPQKRRLDVASRRTHSVMEKRHRSRKAEAKGEQQIETF